MFKDPASKMDTPKVEEIKKDSIKLSWKKPINDGGAKIAGYVIEKKTTEGQWEEVLEVGPKETSATVKDVKENEECQFRIKARNAAGLSEASLPTAILKVEDQPEKPSFEINHIKDIVVKAGQNYDVHVPYKAHPLPTAQWSINDKDVQSETGRIELIVHYLNYFFIKFNLKINSCYFNRH
jgi:hypothetical protein